MYNIYIGNGEMERVEDEEYVTPYAYIIKGEKVYFDVTVREKRLPEAPTFPNDEMTGNSNGRYPSCSVWGDFCRKVGLYTLFFDKQDGLMKDHPGFSILKQEHVEAIEKALTRWQNHHPNAIPGFKAFSWDNDVTEIEYDPILARSLWLDYWVKWAYKNCENAGIYNS